MHFIKSLNGFANLGHLYVLEHYCHGPGVLRFLDFAITSSLTLAVNHFFSYKKIAFMAFAAIPTTETIEAPSIASTHFTTTAAELGY